MISIILPVYNAQNTIKRCVDSIRSQTFTDFELIIVNDGSHDSTAVICDDYQQQDTRISVVHKTNGGVSSARNLGLEYAKGDWITFVDSDDWIEDCFLETIYKEAKEYDLIIEYAKFINHPTGNDILMPNLIINELNFERLFSDCYLSWRSAPWGKLFRRDIIEQNSIRFQIGMNIGEDVVFLYTYLLYAKKILINANRNYCYLYDSIGSLTKRINSVDSELLAQSKMSSAINELIDRYKMTSIRALDELYWLDASHTHRVLNSLYYHDNTKTYRLDIIKDLDMERYLNYYLANSDSYYLRLQKILLENKCFILYDSLRRAVKIFKYKLVNRLLNGKFGNNKNA